MGPGPTARRPVWPSPRGGRDRLTSRRGAPPNAKNPRTEVGRLLFTPGYTSPEQAAGNPVDRCSDVYSMAVTLYRVLAGRSPFHGARDELLHELHGLTSLDFDGRDYLTVWLVGHPLLARRLRLQQHAALAQRIVWYAPMVAKTDPQLFSAMVDHGLAAAAAPPDLITSDARDLILRVSRGIPRLISHLLRIPLVLADERGLASIDVSVVNTAAIVLHLESTRPAVVPPPKPVSTAT